MIAAAPQRLTVGHPPRGPAGCSRGVPASASGDSSWAPSRAPGDVQASPIATLDDWIEATVGEAPVEPVPRRRGRAGHEPKAITSKLPPRLSFPAQAVISRPSPCRPRGRGAHGSRRRREVIWPSRRARSPAPRRSAARAVHATPSAARKPRARAPAARAAVSRALARSSTLRSPCAVFLRADEIGVAGRGR